MEWITFETVIEFLFATPLGAAIFVAILAVALVHFWIKIDKPSVKSIAYDVVEAIHDPDCDAEWRDYFNLFYQAFKHAKDADPDANAFNTALKIFKKEYAADELKNSSEADE